MKRFRKMAVLSGIVLASFLTPYCSFAQDPPIDPGCDPLDPACPIDGGLCLLIAAGIGIGAKKAYNLRKKADAVGLEEN